MNQQVPLLGLPEAPLHDILHAAGPHARELCSVLPGLYGPLPCLTPRKVDDEDALLAALRRDDNRHQQLQALDLRHVAGLITANTLLQLCEALPNLHTLRLPDQDEGCKLTAAEVASATSGLASLTALHVPCMSDLGAAFLAEARAHNLLTLALRTPLLPASVAALAPFSRLSSLSFVGEGYIHLEHVASLAAQLPALVALELQGSFLSCGYPLQKLTRLTSLTLTGRVGGELTMSQRLLGHIGGALFGLRSLSLNLLWDEDEDRKQILWWDRTTALTSLRVSFGTTNDMGFDCWKAFNDTASCVPHLKDLRELHTADRDEAGANLSAAAAGRIAASRSSLGLLHLEELWLPDNVLKKVLPQLAALTCLRLIRNRHATTTFGWLTALTALRQLWYAPVIGSASVLPCQLLAGLSTVTTLSLTRCAFVDASYLKQLCASMPQLRALALRCNRRLGAGLSALQQLTNLEVLDLAGRAAPPAVLEEHVRAPSSLRRCYLGAGYPLEGYEGARAALGSHVNTVFSSSEHSLQ